MIYLTGRGNLLGWKGQEMKDARTALAAYLDRVGLLEASPMGEGETVSVPNQADNDFLASHMRNNARINMALLLCAAGMLLLMFFVAMFLVLHYRNQPHTIAYICGGSFLSLVLLVRWERQLWVDKITTDFFSRAAQTLPPNEVATLAMNYYNLMSSSASSAWWNRIVAKGTS
jgi:hypothetical protein